MIPITKSSYNNNVVFSSPVGNTGHGCLHYAGIAYYAVSGGAGGNCTTVEVYEGSEAHMVLEVLSWLAGGIMPTGKI